MLNTSGGAAKEPQLLYLDAIHQNHWIPLGLTEILRIKIFFKKIAFSHYLFLVNCSVFIAFGAGEVKF